MNIRSILSLSALALAITACEGGGVTLSPSTNVSTNPGTPSGGSGNEADSNPCASYTVSGQAVQGAYDGENCTYDGTFVSNTRPLTVDVLIDELPDGGLHIFEDSLFVGEDVNANSAAQGVEILQDGEGPTLTIEAGSKIAFFNAEDYLRISRGSRIVADGTKEKPIIISAVTDLRDNQATQADRGLWGGVQINGNGLTNKCTEADRQPSGNNPHNCHVTSEGQPATYGGNNNAESSGMLRYVQIRHAGFEVVDGDELNGLTLNAVGAGTTIEYVQTYTTLDDGFEMFGGAVDLKHIVALNVGDDSIDYSEGWSGDIQFALVIHTSGSNRCVEADNTGDSQPDDLKPFTKGRISNMTCITSNIATNEGTAPSSKGDSEGPLYREGAYFEQYNSIITSNADGMASNECLEIESTQSIEGINAGISVASGNVIACTDPLKISSEAGLDLRNWWVSNGNAVVDSTAELPAQVISDLSPANPTAYITSPALADANGNPINVGVFDVTTLQDSFESDTPPAIGSSGSSSFFDSVDFIGAVKEGDDWVAGWTTGL